MKNYEDNKNPIKDILDKERELAEYCSKCDNHHNPLEGCNPETKNIDDQINKAMQNPYMLDFYKQLLKIRSNNGKVQSR